MAEPVDRATLIRAVTEAIDGGQLKVLMREGEDGSAGGMADDIERPIGGRGGGEERPDIQLGVDERRRLQRIERGLGGGGGVEGKVVGEVDRQSPSERLGARTEEGVGELHVGAACAHAFENRTRLQPLSDRWRVHPEERAAAVSPRASPRGEALGDAAPRAQRAQQLSLSRRCDVRRERRQLARGAIAPVKEGIQAAISGAPTAPWRRRRGMRRSSGRRQGSGRR